MTTGLIAYAGEPGAFAEDAANAAFGDAPRLPLGGFREVFEAVSTGRAAAGVAPVENLVNGTVRETYDLLLEHALRIDAEVVVPIDLCLAALPGTAIGAVERVYSHIQALGQAERFLRDRPWTLLTTYNTAGAGKLIALHAEAGAAAVLSRRAALAFGLKVLADGIQDVPDNRTRFLVVAQPRAGEAAPSPIRRLHADAGPPAWRTTLAFGVRNEPGALLAALRAFADRAINLSKLESRPSRTAAWEYVFWVDLDAHQADPDCRDAIEALRAVASMVRSFGSYARAADPPSRETLTR